MTKLILAIALGALSGCSQKQAAAPLVAPRSGPPPSVIQMLAPDATHKELVDAMNVSLPAVEDRSLELQEMASASRRIFAWQAALNARRTPEKQLRLDGGQKGISIDEPFTYNGDTVLKEYRDSIDALDSEMKAVIIDPEAPLPEALTTPDHEFEKRAGKVLAAYDHAIRWESLSPYLEYYKQQAASDVRGYYFLSKVPGLEARLSRWRDLAPDDARKWAAWLTGLCRNGGETLDACSQELKTQEGAGDVLPFYQRHVEAGRTLMKWLFSLDDPRSDVKWEGTGPVVPFTRPARDDLAVLVKALIESAWKGNGWQLRLAYTGRADQNTPHLLFQPGATPHVNKFGGSEITLDENIPPDNEMDTSIFQHEFGHVIGFPDCYVEFFDESTGLMVNYQIDMTNLMCSRTGKVSDSHWEAIRKAYETPRQPSAVRSSRTR